MNMKFTLLVYISTCVIYSAFSQEFYDNFDSYTLNQYLGVESNEKWTAWSGEVGGGGDVLVSDENPYNGNNSIKLVSRDSVNLVLPLGNIKIGRWSLSFMMFVEAGYGAYFNLLHELNGEGSNWAFLTSFSPEGKANLNIANAVGVDFNYPVGEWFPVNIEMDVEDNSGTLSIANNRVGELPWAWFLGTTFDGIIKYDSTISAINFFSTAPNLEEASFYIDDVKFKQLEQTNINVHELNQPLRLYPNPTSGLFSIKKGASEPVDLSVYSAQGKLVYRKTILLSQETIDSSAWAPGVYLLKQQSKNEGIKTTKLIVK